MQYKMNIPQLSRDECTVMRGMAILGIVLHNYAHWLGPIVKENEYQFFKHNIAQLGQVIANPDYLLPLHLLSFFGHYGVPIFLFLSAYGLEIKYSATSIPMPMPSGRGPRVWPFIWKHFMKLFRMMFVGFIIFTVVDAITPGRWHYTLLQVVAQIGMFGNVLPAPDHQIWPGPYWFFGLMLQLYIVYRLLLYRRHWGWTVGLMVVCLAVQMCLGPESETINWYRYNFMGGMLPFGLGLLFARFGQRIILVNLGTAALWMSLVVTIVLVVSLSGSFWGWSVVPIFVCIAAVYFVKAVNAITYSQVGYVVWLIFQWLGTISAALFVIHPTVRKVFINGYRQGDIYAGLLLYVFASLAAAYLLHRAMAPKRSILDILK